jgi:starch synthase (maltosyl-transferring)
MRFLGNDRWRATFTPAAVGRCLFTIEAALDVWATWRNELAKKSAAGVDTKLEVEEGRQLVKAAAAHAPAGALDALIDGLSRSSESRARELLLAEATDTLMASLRLRRFATRLAPEAVVEIERKQALFASWYELFPRSQAREPGRHGTFDDVIARLPAIRAMGFDVLYFPPIHPIGTTNRKGRNNSLKAAPGDPGSPYAIGSAEGGHDTVHPELGGLEAFRRLRAAAADEGLELALDLAVQFSPDHPWLKEHPDWFSWRPDGSLRFAENPPKKYEDIVMCDFYAPAATPALWLALRDVVEHWVNQGVQIFRVDNPHTKPLPFWEWLMRDIRARHPDVLFLSEAFTRPAMMYGLAKIGFSQSYTYFTWRNTKTEFTQYLTELTREAPKDFFRPHFFVNTPDINPHFLQTSGRPGFLIRAALASTLSGLWGLYSGFELCEAAPLSGKEEYLDSEKYELRPRDWNAPGNIIAEITQLNRIRRENPALQTHLGVTFYNAFNDRVLYFGKRTPDQSSFILVAISLDPHQVQETHFEAPLWEFGLPDHGALEVEELMRKLRFTWHGKVQHWRFVPGDLPFAIWRIKPARA